jgi:hypothetical protein
MQRLLDIYGDKVSITNNFPEKQIAEKNSGSYGKPDLDLFVGGKHKLVEVKGMQVFWQAKGAIYEKRGKLALSTKQWQNLVESSTNGAEPCLIVELKTRCVEAPHLYFMLERQLIDAWKQRFGEWISPSVWEIIDKGQKLELPVQTAEA